MTSVSSSEQVRAKTANGKVLHGDLGVSKAISKWHILSPLSIALPNSDDFKPVMLIDCYREKAFFSNKRKSMFSIVYSGFAAIVTLLLFALTSDKKLFDLTIACLVLALYFTVEHITLSSNIKTLTDRNIFISSFAKNYKCHVLKWLIICAVFGVIQTTLNGLVGGFEAAIYRYGGIYTSIYEGEWWRIFTASAFHSGLIHWFVNLALALIAGPLFMSLVGSVGLFTLFVGCTVGSLFSFLLFLGGFTNADAYVGISAGIYALLGYVAVLTFKNTNLKTGRIHLSIINFLFMSTALSLLLAPSTSNVAHLSGFLCGSLLAYFIINKNSNKS